MHYTISSLYTVKKHYLSIKDTVFHFTRISLYTIYLEKQKSCKVRATLQKMLENKSWHLTWGGPINSMETCNMIGIYNMYY